MHPGLIFSQPRTGFQVASVHSIALWSLIYSSSMSSGISPGARLSNRVQYAAKRTSTLPVGPFRCFATMSSAKSRQRLSSGV